MIISFKMRYWDRFENLEVELEELKGWLNLDVDETEPIDVIQSKVQEAVKKQYNNDEYNTYRVSPRYNDKYLRRFDDEGHAVDPFDYLMNKISDSSIYFQDVNETKENMEYEKCCKLIRKTIKKKELADMYIAIVLDEIGVKEYAILTTPRESGITDDAYKKLIDKKANNISHKIKRVSNKLAKVIKR